MVYTGWFVINCDVSNIIYIYMFIDVHTRFYYDIVILFLSFL